MEIKKIYEVKVAIKEISFKTIMKFKIEKTDNRLIVRNIPVQHGKNVKNGDLINGWYRSAAEMFLSVMFYFLFALDVNAELFSLK